MDSREPGVADFLEDVLVDMRRMKSDQRNERDRHIAMYILTAAITTLAVTMLLRAFRVL